MEYDVSTQVEYYSWKNIYESRGSDFYIFITLIVFMVSDFINMILRGIIPDFKGQNVLVFVIEEMIMGILFFFCHESRKGEQKVSVWHLFLLIYIFIIISIIAHPEYIDWYFHEEYGVIDNLFNFRKGIYAIYIVSFFYDKRLLLSAIIYASRINLLGYVFQYLNAYRRGYWVSHIGDGSIVHLNYSLYFGYQVVFCALLFLGLFIFNGKMADIFGFIISMALLLLAGSRGPFICLAVGIILFVILKLRMMNFGLFKSFIVTFLMLVIIGILTVEMSNLENILIAVVSRLHISGRTVTMILSGRFMDDNGRNAIWSIAKDMIKKEGLLGYGFYGDRFVIGKSWYYGYPHNFIYEVIIEFGLIVGSVIIITLFYRIAKMFVLCKDANWGFLFALLVSSCAKLALSDSFWYYWPFWALIAVLKIWNKDNSFIRFTIIDRTGSNEST